MNTSASDIISNVFEEHSSNIINLSSYPRDTKKVLQDMQCKLNDRLSAHYYSNVFKFVSSVDIEDVISASPPRDKIIKSCEVKTPEKQKIKYIKR